jgi:hypothetical protein
MIRTPLSRGSLPPRGGWAVGGLADPADLVGVLQSDLVFEGRRMEPQSSSASFGARNTGRTGIVEYRPRLLAMWKILPSSRPPDRGCPSCSAIAMIRAPPSGVLRHGSRHFQALQSDASSIPSQSQVRLSSGGCTPRAGRRTLRGPSLTASPTFKIGLPVTQAGPVEWPDGSPGIGNPGHLPPLVP